MICPPPVSEVFGLDDLALSVYVGVCAGVLILCAIRAITDWFD